MGSSETFYSLVSSFASLGGISIRDASRWRVYVGLILYTVKADDPRKQGHHSHYWRIRWQQEIIKWFIFICIALYIEPFCAYHFIGLSLKKTIWWNLRALAVSTPFSRCENWGLEKLWQELRWRSWARIRTWIFGLRCPLLNSIILKSNKQGFRFWPCDWLDQAWCWGGARWQLRDPWVNKQEHVGFVF